MTVSFTIKRPWPHYFPDGQHYFPAFVTIWHHDPETDGSDDSCGWAFPRLTSAHVRLVDALTEEDMAFPYFSAPPVRASRVVNDARYPYGQLPPGDAMALLASAWMMVAWRLDRRRLTPHDWIAILNLAVCPNDNLRASLVADEEHARQLVHDFYCHVLRNYLRFRRPWYRHPRWHVWHWSIQVEPLLHLKRWLFTRCCVCHARFRYGESPVSGQWGSTGPRWFHSELHVAHADCYGSTALRQEVP